MDGKENPIDVSRVAVSVNGIELQDREFFSAIAEGRQPSSSAGQALGAFRTLHTLEESLH